jgi:hypothetical protein
MHLTRETLYHRHRLSHQQIDQLLNEHSEDLIMEEKLTQLSQVAEFLEIAALLNNADIWFIPFKGPLLSYRIYGDATCRISKDFDLLVLPESMSDVIALLRTMGYTPRSFNWPGPGSRRNRILAAANQICFVHPEKHASVEVHWRLLKFPAISPARVDKAIAEHTTTINFSGLQLRQFTLEFELLQLVIHGGLHTWSRLKWLLDIHEIVKRYRIDGDKFSALVKEFRAQRMVGLCNVMLGLFFPGTALLPANCKVPDWYTGYTLFQFNRETVVPNFLPGDFFRYHRFHVCAFTGLRYRITRTLAALLYLLQLARKS